MKNFVPAQLTLCSMPQREIRGLSFTSAIRSGLRPYEYKSVIEASCWRPFWISRYGEKRPALGATSGTYPRAKSLCCTPMMIVIPIATRPKTGNLTSANPA